MSAPRCFVIRHGETEWSLNGRHTGTTELPLTENGKKRIRATGHALVGEDRLIAPSKIAHVFVSPRKRAQLTLQLLNLGVAIPEHIVISDEEVQVEANKRVCSANVEITPDLAEWDYGDYEGKVSKEIRESRKAKGLDADHPWDIWRDGCEGGESPEEVTARCDRLIQTIRENYHSAALESKDKAHPGDVVLVGHGHILRAFTMRWLGKKLSEGPNMLLEAGGVGTLSYEHNNLGEPALLLGGGFVVDLVEKEHQKAVAT